MRQLCPTGFQNKTREVLFLKTVDMGLVKRMQREKLSCLGEPIFPRINFKPAPIHGSSFFPSMQLEYKSIWVIDAFRYKMYQVSTCKMNRHPKKGIHGDIKNHHHCICTFRPRQSMGNLKICMNRDRSSTSTKKSASRGNKRQLITEKAPIRRALRKRSPAKTRYAPL